MDLQCFEISSNIMGCDDIQSRLAFSNSAQGFTIELLFHDYIT